MYLAGVSVRRVEDITEALWGTRVSPLTVSDLNKRIYGTIEAWRNPPFEREHPYVLPGRHRAQAQLGRRGLQRIAVGGDRRREILGICEGAKEDKGSVQSFFAHLVWAEWRPALAQAVMAPLICWSLINSMFKYLLVDHAVPAMWRSLAAARLRADCPSGNAPTTRVRRLISRRLRSSGLLVRILRQCAI
jgi:putative transposase